MTRSRVFPTLHKGGQALNDKEKNAEEGKGKWTGV